MTGSLNILDLIDGYKIELTPPNLELIFKHKFASVCGDVLITFFACMHCVAIPKIVSPTLLTSAYNYN